MKIKHCDTGIEADYVPWDGVLSMSDGRCWHSCPVCGIGVSSFIGGPYMAHKGCLDQLHRALENLG